MKKFIIRTIHAGVFYGEIKERKGDEAVLANVRRIWFWSGAATLSQMAQEGVKNPRRCKFTVYVPEMTVLGVIEVIPCTEAAIKSIESVEAWRL